MTPAELTLTAALGASFLTGLASFGAVWFQEQRRSRASDRASLDAAMLAILSHSIAFALRAGALAQAMRLRSGLGESLNVMLRYRKLLDPLQLHDWMARDLAPLTAALDDIWTHGDQEAVRLANDVVNKCMDVLQVSTSTRPVRHWWDWVHGSVLSLRWTPAMQAAYDDATKELAQSRKRFADYARSRLGQEVVELFAPTAEKVETP